MPLNGTQFRIVMLIWRETYGFSRKECQISESYIAARLSLRRQNIHREIKELFDYGILTIVREASFNSSRIITFNKDYDEWQKRLHDAKVITGIEYDSSPVIKNDSSPVIGFDSHRKKPLNKPSNKYAQRDSYKSRFQKFWQAYPKKRSKGDAEKAWKALKPDDALLADILKSIELQKQSINWQKDGGQYIPYPATFLRAKGWLDETTQAQTASPDIWGDIPTL